MDTCSTDEFRVCKKCEQKLPNTAEYFYHAKQKTKDGIYTPSLRSKCKSCYVGPKKEKVITTHKTCTNCKTEFLKTTDNFRLLTDIKGCRYLMSYCKKCERIHGSKYRYSYNYKNNILLAKRKTKAKALGISIEQYSTGRYKGWSAHKKKFPSSTYEEYLQYKETTDQRMDANRKKQRDTLTDNYVRSLIAKRTKMGTEVLYDLSALIETYKLNLLIKRKVNGKYNTA
jgi:hypothetical protein